MKPSPEILTKLEAIGESAVEAYRDDMAEWRSLEHFAEAGPPSKDLRQGLHPEPVHGAAFDDDGCRVATVEPQIYFDDPEEAGRDVFTEKLSNFLSWLVEGDSVESAGRKALMVAHLAGRTTSKDDASLSKKLGVSKARISQLRREIGNDFKGFASAKGRAA